ncbi:hypothetical protein PPO43_12745 [Saprospira sp. CCB-QB6]|uniref:hypothetical protein n=1 Tax=Saprospira sp. CCB-QB6 TaxID=3023936 RepID=UPI00234A46ED|nr:hypothetical protein [Saprospira sp. CCB-QB6]WCL80840.1 hypothetical protein PPO43_12745 [Saprospira sp. CCB-QB6]
MLRYYTIFCLFGLLFSCQNESINSPLTQQHKLELEELRSVVKEERAERRINWAKIDLEQIPHISEQSKVLQEGLKVSLETEDKNESLVCSILDQNGALQQQFFPPIQAGKKQKLNLDFSQFQAGEYYVVILGEATYRRFSVAKLR